MLLFSKLRLRRPYTPSLVNAITTIGRTGRALIHYPNRPLCFAESCLINQVERALADANNGPQETRAR